MPDIIKNPLLSIINNRVIQTAILLAFTAGVSWAVMGGKFEEQAKNTEALTRSVNSLVVIVKTLEKDQAKDNAFRISGDRYSSADALRDQIRLRKEFKDEVINLRESIKYQMEKDRAENTRVMEKLIDRIHDNKPNQNK